MWLDLQLFCLALSAGSAICVWVDSKKPVRRANGEQATRNTNRR